MKATLLLTCLLLSTTSFAATPKTYTVELSLTTAAGLTTPRVQVRDGDSFKIATGEADAKVSVSFTVSAAGAGAVKLDGAVRCADGAAVTRTLAARLGEAATVDATGPNDTRCTVAMTVREENQPPAPN
jgi:hypothetical protein